jgi:hypothetical protein
MSHKFLLGTDFLQMQLSSAQKTVQMQTKHVNRVLISLLMKLSDPKREE